MSTFPAVPGGPTGSAVNVGPGPAVDPSPAAVGAATGAADAVAPRAPSDRAEAGPSLSLELFPPRPGRYTT